MSDIRDRLGFFKQFFQFFRDFFQEWLVIFVVNNGQEELEIIFQAFGFRGIR